MKHGYIFLTNFTTEQRTELLNTLFRLDITFSIYDAIPEGYTLPILQLLYMQDISEENAVVISLQYNSRFEDLDGVLGRTFRIYVEEQNTWINFVERDKYRKRDKIWQT